MNKSNKTLWQRIYSFFGFWTYIQHIGNKKAYLVVYWCCFPWKFYRKFDIFRYDISKKESINVRRAAQMEKQPDWFF